MYCGFCHSHSNPTSYSSLSVPLLSVSLLSQFLFSHSFFSLTVTQWVGGHRLKRDPHSFTNILLLLFLSSFSLPTFSSLDFSPPSLNPWITRKNHTNLPFSLTLSLYFSKDVFSLSFSPPVCILLFSNPYLRSFEKELTPLLLSHVHTSLIWKVVDLFVLLSFGCSFG